MKCWMFLAIAIFCECVATSFLKASDGFTRIVPTLIACAGYLICFYSLSLSLRDIPLGIAYAVWSGAGIVVLTIVGMVYFENPIDGPAVIGIGLIILGVLIINLYSNANIRS